MKKKLAVNFILFYNDTTQESIPISGYCDDSLLEFIDKLKKEKQ